MWILLKNTYTISVTLWDSEEDAVTDEKGALHLRTSKYIGRLRPESIPISNTI
jgi:hypothetical protein